jgi:hypothetical protein
MTTIIDISSGKVEDSESQEPIPFMARPKQQSEPTLVDRGMAAMQDPNNIVMGSAEAPFVGLNQMLAGAGGMVADPLAFGKSMVVDMLSGRAFDQGSQGLSYLQNSWQKAVERAHAKGQEAAADVQKVFGYEPKTAIGQKVVEDMGTAFGLPGKALNIKGDWYKPLGLKSVEADSPIVAHYLELGALVYAGKAAKSAGELTKAKYNTLAKKFRKVKETGVIPDDFELMQEQLDALALKENKSADVRAAQKAMAEHETRMAELRPKTLAEQRQAQIDEAIPAESPIAQTPKERQKVISNTPSDVEVLPDQPPRVVQPIDQLKQAQEVGQILQGQKPPPTPVETFNTNYSRAGLGEVPNVNDRWRRIFTDTSPAEIKAIELAQKAKYPAQVPKPRMEMPKIEVETKPVEAPVIKNSSQETLVETPRPERRSREYVPSSSKATLEDFPIGRETSQIIKNYRDMESGGLYTTRGGNTDFVSHGKAAAVAKKNGGTVLPKEDGKFVVALEPKSRVMFERDAIREESARLQKADEATGLSPIDNATPVEGKEAGMVERPASPQGKSPEAAIAEMKDMLPALDKWTKGDESVPIEELKKRIESISNEYISDTGMSNEIFADVERISNGLLVEINRADMNRKGVKIEEIADLQPETLAELTAIADAAEGKASKTSPALTPEALREIRKQEVRARWEEIKASRIETPQQAIAVADGVRNHPKPKHNRKMADDEAAQWLLDREKNDPVLRDIAESENRRAIDMDQPAENIDAGDLWGAFKSILSNDEGSWTIRDKTPAERLRETRIEHEAWLKEFEENKVAKNKIVNISEKILDKKSEKVREELKELVAEFKQHSDSFEAFKKLQVEIKRKGFKLINNEEGQWTLRSPKPETRASSPVDRLTPEQIASIDKVWKVARRTGVEPNELMKRSGISDEVIALANKVYDEHITPMRKKGLEVVLQGPYKDRDPSQVISQRDTRNYKGQVVTKAPVMKPQAEAFANMFDITHQGKITNPIYTFKQLPPELQKWYYDWREAESRVYDRKKAIVDRIDMLSKGLSPKEMKQIGDYSIANQGKEGSPERTRGQEIVKALGLKPPKALTQKQLELYKAGREVFDEMLARTNEIRTAIGKNPIRQIEDYFTFMRSFSMKERFAAKGVRRTNVILDELPDLDHMHKSFEEARFPFTRRSPVGSFAIERDYASVLKKYVSAAVRQQEVSPLMAEISETLRGFSTDNINPKTGRNEYFNARGSVENTASFLADWSNHIGGVTPDTLNPKLRFLLQTFNRNLAWSTLSGNMTSFLLQPASFANTIGQIGSYHTIKGISESVLPSNWKMALKESNVLKSMVMELDLGDGKMSWRTPIKSGAELGMKPLQWLDSQARVGTWLGAKEYGAARGLKGKELINFADDVVTTTQASTLAGDVAPLQRTTVGRTIGQFQTFMINDWNFMTRELFGRGGGKPLIAEKGALEAGTLRKTVRYALAAMLLNEVYKAGNLRAPFPDIPGAVKAGMDEGDNALQIGWAVAGEFAEKLPFVGNIKYGKGLLPPVVDTANKLLVESGKDVDKFLEEGETPINTIEGTARLGGLPGTNALAKYLRAKERGEEGWNAAVGRYQK